jgi:hypothetical protein
VTTTTLKKIYTCFFCLQVEELQWRIKHNNELPSPQVFSPTTSLSTTGDEESPQTFLAPATAASGLACHGSIKQDQTWNQQEPLMNGGGAKVNE